VQELEVDVAELEQLRQLLRQEYSFRNSVIECASEGVCVCHAIQEFPFIQFTVWNSSMEKIVGYSMEDINRLGWYQTMYPDKEIQERARQRMTEMRKGDDLKYEHWDIIRADGERRTLGISTSILTTDDGQIHVLGLMHDVTEEERYRKEMESRITSLEGILPICASCKKIRNEMGIWQQLEVYIKDHSRADFSHGICPNCVQKLYPDFKE
jgi:PAS domain S-box-containing protein